MKPQGDPGLSFGHFTNFWWGELSKKVSGAIVFVDNPIAECLHWNCGGAVSLFKAGAIGVRELSSFESGGKEHNKAVFVVSGAVVGPSEMSVRDIILGSRFEHCVVVTAAPATVHPVPLRLGPADPHAEDDPNNRRAFVELENKLLRWMGNEELTAEVLYCPLFAAQLHQDFFIAPLFADLISYLSPVDPMVKGPAVGHQPSTPVHNKRLQRRLHHLAACLHSLLAFMGAREDLFSVGPLGAALAAELDELPVAKSRRKTAERRVALVLVDRSLDLATACSLDTSSCLLDRVLAVLPAFPGHSAERAVDMSPLCAAKTPEGVDLPLPLAWGCALQPSGLSTLIDSRSTKEGLMALQRSFLEVSPGAVSLRVTPESLAKRAKALAQDNGLKMHAALLQQCLGVLQSLSGPKSINLDLLAGLQKVLVQNLAIGGEQGLADVLNQVATLLRTRKDRGLDVGSILLLLIQSFSLAGPDLADQSAVGDEVEQLMKVLAQALLEDASESENIENCLNPINDEAQASEAASEMIRRLFDIARARQLLLKYREVLHRPSAQIAAEVRPLLPRLLADCLDPSRPELAPDVVTSSSSGLLGMFLSSAKPHPSDSPLMILLVLGGITGAELRALRAVTSQHPQRRVIIGSSSLMCPYDALAFLRPQPS